MTELRIDTPGGRTAFDPQDEVDVTLSWDMDQRPERVELRIVWNTTGKGTTDLGVVQTIPFDTTSARETRQARITLPRSPYSFSGQLISLIWALEMVAFPSESSTRKEIIIAPVGREIRLTPIAHEEA